MEMELVIVGSGTATPYARRGSSGIAIKLPEEVLLFDSGSGTLQRLDELRIDFARLENVFYTHFHLDHVSDLPNLLFAKRDPTIPSKRNKDLTIHGPMGIWDLVAGYQELFPGMLEPREETWELTVNELPKDGEPVQGPGWTVSYMPMNHRPESIGYRIQDAAGRSIVYTGDTGYCPEAVTLARHADLLITECSFPERHQVDHHLIPRLAGRIAREAKVKRLVLTHLYPVADKFDIVGAVEREFKGDIHVAEDRMRIGL